MPDFLTSLDTATAAMLFVGLAVAFLFEFVNGFHDTANAVATVIYTRSLEPTTAVVWSGIWNALGVLHASTTGLVVAFSIVHLLPVELLVSLGRNAGIAMVFSLLLAAVLWNLGTWLLGLPASSSHSLIGAVLGVGLAASLESPGGFGSGVNWAKAGQVLLSLVVSPVAGFALGAAALYGARRLMPAAHLHEPAPPGEQPPLAVRGLLVLSCTGVSFAHGSNDGQKGIGLIMLILIGILPAAFALNVTTSQETLQQARAAAGRLHAVFAEMDVAGQTRTVTERASARDHVEWNHIELTRDPIVDHRVGLLNELQAVTRTLEGHASLGDIHPDERWTLRTQILRVRQAVRDYHGQHAAALPPSIAAVLVEDEARLTRLTEYAPDWVPIGVALALGLGTMIGWKRIVVTVGEKLGTTPMSYAQGTTAQLVTAATILAADVAGAPVSTTHVLSSGMAGSLAAGGSRLQASTLRQIALAWVLTLPASMLLGAGLYLAANAVLR